MKLNSINPFNQKIVGSVDISTSQEIKHAVLNAKKAFPKWKETPVEKRASYIKKLAKLVSENKEKLARLTTLEMGKPIKEARDDVEFESDYYNYYIAYGTQNLKDELIKKEKDLTYKLVFEPYGVCASIAPWNFPLSNANWAVIPAILAGNTVVFKPSEYSTLSQKLFIELLNKTGLPEGVVNIIFGDGSVGRKLVDADIDLIKFTGSSKVGKEIYQKAAKKFIKAVLELGGSSAGIIFEDVNPEEVIDSVYSSRFFNCGQVCSALKRLFVHKKLFKPVVDLLVDKIKKVKLGNPMEEETEIGPLVSKIQLKTLMNQVEDAVKKGAKIVIGGSQPKDPQLQKGNFYLPTILTGIKSNMKIITEETFGPVLPIMSFENEDEAVTMANNTYYGLSAQIYTNDSQKGKRVAGKIDSGMVGINNRSFYRPFCPTGGMKKSGIGREHGREGLRELTQIKLLAIKT